MTQMQAVVVAVALAVVLRRMAVVPLVLGLVLSLAVVGECLAREGQRGEQGGGEQALHG